MHAENFERKTRQSSACDATAQTPSHPPNRRKVVAARCNKAPSAQSGGHALLRSACAGLRRVHQLRGPGPVDVLPMSAQRQGAHGGRRRLPTPEGRARVELGLPSYETERSSRPPTVVLRGQLINARSTRGDSPTRRRAVLGTGADELRRPGRRARESSQPDVQRTSTAS